MLVDLGLTHVHCGNLPDQGAEAGNGSGHGETALEEDDIAALHEVEGALAAAGLAVEEAAIIVAVADGDIVDVTGAARSHGGKGSQPKDHQQAVDDNGGDDVIGRVERGDL